MVDDEGRRVSEPDYWFMRLSLLYSNIYDTISRRLGMALLAQRRISGYNSGPLEDNHWMSEVEMLFSTSLARIQFDAWSIASGEGHDRDGYIDGTPLEAGPPGSLCGLFKFKTRSHKNINLVWFIAAVALLPFLWFITLEGDNSFFSWAWGWLKPFIASLYCYSSKTSSSSSAVEATRPSGYSTFRSDSNTRGQTSPPASRHSAYSSGRQRQRPEGQHQPNVVTSLLSNTAANGTLGTRLNTPESRDHDNNPQTEVDDVQNQSDTESDVTEQPISGPEDRASDDRSGGSVHPELKIEWRYLVLDVAIEALFLLPGWILTSIKHCTRHCASKRSQSARESNQ
ncbi:hypothetical protein P152DRAFT_25090 [Eremomyces bilateralis CBS 781.70]|uniref:Uncharacterized protein n=1 Tax=Eremomyces bilateralis CBS 781.70 TaxID=1392243 RepID=A0A6G1GHZ4_9PEZI|nr:uncharacterized protein P152DRAFT_25090 [Eremomyces bilateralis CBS 781.70]KAF1817624.1 hypothetical protein P152DRAFT_25090 [Eremomyces bilateralis CBS 781.70]